MNSKNLKEKINYIFVNRYFFPDFSATSQLLSDLAFELASDNSNYEVHIITSRQSYDNAKQKYPANESIDGVKITRVWSTTFGRLNLLGRVVDYLTFYTSAFYQLSNLVKSGDVVVAKTDPPLVAVLAAFIVNQKNAVLINWIQDLFPEIAQALDIKAIKPFYTMLVKLRNYSLRKGATNVVLGKRMAEKLRQENIPLNRIKIIPNWADGDAVIPLSHDKNLLRKTWALQNKFVVGYSGNIGRAHEINTIIDAAKLLRNEDSIVFLIVGGGARYDDLRRKVQENELDNFLFRPYQPRDQLPQSLTLPDLHLISLLPEMEGLIVPSKFYGTAAAGRPSLFIGDSNGEIAQIIKEYGCGVSACIGDAEEAAHQIKRLSENPKITQKMGLAARRAYEKKYNKNCAIKTWQQLLLVETVTLPQTILVNTKQPSN